MSINWRRVLSISLRVFMVLIAFFFLIEWIATLYEVLLSGSTEQDEPILIGLGSIYSFLRGPDIFLKMIFSSTFHHYLFKHWVMGGFFLFFFFITLAFNHGKEWRNFKEIPYSWWGVVGLFLVNLGLLFVCFFNSEVITFYADLSWTLDLYHKAQFSVTIFLGIVFFFLFTSLKKGKKINERTYTFCTTPWLYSCVLIELTLETMANFSWFPGGYKQILLFGEGWISVDKLFHFSMSFVMVLLVWNFVKNKWISGAIVVFFHGLWELFEYVVQPGIIGDTWKDEVTNITAVIIAIIVIILVERYKRKKRNKKR
ncbi:MAG: hypothetical protein ACTSQ4_11665 [Candidatus Heimdallarchaeaceae archaeon]